MKATSADNHSAVDSRVRDGILSLIREYRRAFGVDLACVDHAGRILVGRINACGCGTSVIRGLRSRLITESLRWGAPFLDLCPCGRMTWGLAITVNQEVLGGVVAAVAPRPRLSTRYIRKAADALLEMAGRHNLTNTAWLARNHELARQERYKAEAIHEAKEGGFDQIRAVYLQEEPGLIAAIRKGERGEARAIINRILVGIYCAGRERMDLLKSLVMELVVMMSRAAVECGADPSCLLGRHYRGLSELASIEDDEALTRWLTSMLEGIMDAIGRNPEQPGALLLAKALRHMQEHLSEDNLTRDAVARVAGLSSSHFSHLMKAHLKTSFTELLTRYRVDRASRLLARSTDSVAEIAMACGFPDQSYFTKVFKRYTGFTPLAYRNARR